MLDRYVKGLFLLVLPTCLKYWVLASCSNWSATSLKWKVWNRLTFIFQVYLIFFSYLPKWHWKTDAQKDFSINKLVELVSSKFHSGHIMRCFCKVLVEQKWLNKKKLKDWYCCLQTLENIIHGCAFTSL